MKAVPVSVPDDVRWTVSDANGVEVWAGMATCEEEAFMMADREVAGVSDPPAPWVAKCEC